MNIIMDHLLSKVHQDPSTYLAVLSSRINDWICVAGYAGDADQWETAHAEWEKEWVPRDNLSRVILTTVKSGLVPFVAAIRVSDYDDLVTGSVLEKRIKGYRVCCGIIASRIAHSLPNDRRVEFLFRERGDYDRGFMQSLEDLIDDSKEVSIKECLTSQGALKLDSTGIIIEGKETGPADSLIHALYPYLEDGKTGIADALLLLIMQSPSAPKWLTGDTGTLGVVLDRDEARRRIAELS